MAKLFATTDPRISQREIRNMSRARRIAAEGMVLLQNDGTLPLKECGKIALYGNGARSTIKGGTGSGDVNSRMVVNVEQGLEEAGFQVSTKNWLERYDQAIESARKVYFADIQKRMKEDRRNGFWFMFNNPFCEPVIIPVTEEDLRLSDTDTAVFTISRKSGEGKDRKPVAGEYELFEEEKEAIKTLVKHYKKVIVVLNVGAVIDTKFLRNTDGIHAIVLMSQAGNIGGHALADILTGKVNPSGHLTATWAENYTDYPGADEFSHMNGNVDDEFYRESIYVGYRYFDTFGVCPASPFGYGLSYTTFDMKTDKVEVEKNRIRLTIKVKNTGKVYAGREVVQVYYSAPGGGQEKPYQELAAFAKTRELEPGEEETVTIVFEAERMASYDVSRAAWVLEAGTYLLRVGDHSRNTHTAAKVVLKKTAITQKLRNLFVNNYNYKVLSAAGAASFTYPEENSEKETAATVELDEKNIACTEAVYSEENKELPKPAGEKIITVDDVKEGRAALDELVGQLSVRELAELCVGTARGGIGAESAIGAASLTPGAAGDTSGLLAKERNLRSMVLADGPAGLRLARKFMADKEGTPIPGTGEAPMPGLELLLDDFKHPVIEEDAVTYYQYCTALPIATLLAQTWDMEALEEAGDIVGGEMKEFGIQIWLAPGMNIQRNPLCGRNFEYYSEDPFITGMCAANETRGVQKHAGVGTCIKHFAFNNQEENRMRTNAYIDERAIREIYLKGFEIAVREAQPLSIMTSYNLIQEVHTANSKELLTYVARDEWGFEGFIMSDWGATGSMDANRSMDGFKYDYASSAGCIKAGNDLIMPGSRYDIDHIIRAVGAGEGEVECPITLADLQACAKRLIRVIMKSSAYEGYHH